MRPGSGKEEGGEGEAAARSKMMACSLPGLNIAPLHSALLIAQRNDEIVEPSVLVLMSVLFVGVGASKKVSGFFGFLAIERPCHYSPSSQAKDRDTPLTLTVTIIHAPPHRDGTSRHQGRGHKEAEGTPRPVASGAAAVISSSPHPSSSSFSSTAAPGRCFGHDATSPKAAIASRKTPFPRLRPPLPDA